MPPLISQATRALGAIPRWISKFLKGWLRWFWQLGNTAKVCVTVLEMVALYVTVMRLPVRSAERTSLIEVGCLALVFLLIAGVLFARN